MNRSTLLSALLLPACVAGPASSTDDTGASTEIVNPIAGTFTILDASNGSGVADASIRSSAGEEASTDASGSATVSVESNSTFQVQLTKEGALDHILFGPTGQDDFEFVTFLATQFLVDYVTNDLGTSPAPGTGVLVVGVDNDDLSPAVGAAVSIGAAHDSPWIIGGMGPAFGNSIPSGGMGMVAFSGVLPGSVSIDVAAPQGKECTAFPGNGEMPEAPVRADTVTVVAFHCR